MPERKMKSMQVYDDDRQEIKRIGIDKKLNMPDVVSHLLEVYMPDKKSTFRRTRETYTSYSCKIETRCGICGKEIVIFMKKPEDDAFKYSGNAGEDITFHVMEHWLNGEIHDKKGFIHAVISFGERS